MRRTQLQPGYLFVAPWDVTDVGGVNQVILNLSRLMREGGTYVPKIVVASWTGAASPVNLRNGVPVSRMRLRAPLMPGAPVRSAIKWAATLVPDLVRLARCLRNDEIATVNVHYPSLAALQIVLARVLLRRSLRIILSFHGLDVSHALGTAGLERWLWRRLLRNVDVIVACSDALGRRVAHLDPCLRNRITTVHNGIDIDHVMRARNPLARVDARLQGQTFILSVASYEAKKGLDVLLRAFGALHAERATGAMLALVGPDLGDGNRLRGLAKALGVSDRVVFCGEVPHADLHAYYGAATVFCLASRAEPFGIVLLEAAAFRRAVVATSVGGIPEVLTHDVNARLGPPDDAAALAAQLRRLLDSASERDRLAGALFEHVRANFPWTRALRSYMALCEPPGGPAQMGIGQAPRATVASAVSARAIMPSRRR